MPARRCPTGGVGRSTTPGRSIGCGGATTATWKPPLDDGPEEAPPGRPEVRTPLGGGSSLSRDLGGGPPENLLARQRLYLRAMDLQQPALRFGKPKPLVLRFGDSFEAAQEPPREGCRERTAGNRPETRHASATATTTPAASSRRAPKAASRRGAGNQRRGEETTTEGLRIIDVPSSGGSLRGCRAGHRGGAGAAPACAPERRQGLCHVSARRRPGGLA